MCAALSCVNMVSSQQVIDIVGVLGHLHIYIYIYRDTNGLHVCSLLEKEGPSFVGLYEGTRGGDDKGCGGAQREKKAL